MADSRQIIEKAGILFKKYGIKSISMDDVAREFGMSKKTLYQIFEDKNELVELVLKNDFRIFREKVLELDREHDDVILQYIKLIQFIRDFLLGASVVINYDLKKYHCYLYEEIRLEYLRLTFEILQKNIRKGRQKGFYRMNMDEDILAKFHLVLFEYLPEKELMSERKYSEEETASEIIKFMINGLVNNNGREYLKKYFGEMENTNKTKDI